MTNCSPKDGLDGGLLQKKKFNRAKLSITDNVRFYIIESRSICVLFVDSIPIPSIA